MFVRFDHSLVVWVARCKQSDALLRFNMKRDRDKQHAYDTISLERELRAILAAAKWWGLKYERIQSARYCWFSGLKAMPNLLLPREKTSHPMMSSCYYNDVSTLRSQGSREAPLSRPCFAFVAESETALVSTRTCFILIIWQPSNKSKEKDRHWK